METFAYLQMATAYEDRDNIVSRSELDRVILFKGVDWKNLPSGVWMRLLSVALTLSLVSVTTEAMALQRGARGCEVSVLQARLQAAGYYNGAIDGIFGAGTDAALRRFQQAKGISIDGVAGSQTRSALKRAFARRNSNLASSGQPARRSFEFSRR